MAEREPNDDPPMNCAFLSRCHQVIEQMRAAGINDANIACIISDIRAAAIEEERNRFDLLRRDNPPRYPRWPVVMDQIGEMFPAAKSEKPFLVKGRVTGKLREGDQVPGWREAICHACGLGYRCMDEDCPNDKPHPMFEAAANLDSVKP